MYHCTKISIADLNPHLMCVLCGGYFIDATTIIECLHSFCRTCIVRYLESSKFCPICDVQVHKTRPLLNIRSDKTLQDLVYKLVPGLFKEEMRRRREFLAQHPEISTTGMDLEQRGMAHLVPAHSLPEERISLVLQLATPGSSETSYSELLAHSNTSLKARDRRYLLCPSDVSIGHLKKFVRLKFGLPEKYKIDVYYKESEETINDDFTLLDVTFIYSWNRKKPLRLFYCIYEKPRQKRKLTVAQRTLVSRSSPVKKMKGEEPKNTHTHTDQLNKTSSSVHKKTHTHTDQLDKSSASPVHKKKLNGQRSPLKKAQLSALCSKTSKAKKEVWKNSRPFGAKIGKQGKAALGRAAQTNGVGQSKRKPGIKVSAAASGRSSLSPDKNEVRSKPKDKNKNTKSEAKPLNAKLDSENERTNGLREKTYKVLNGCSSPSKNHDNKNSQSVSPTLPTSFYRKSNAVSATAVSKGRSVPKGDETKSLKETHAQRFSSRSSSPKLSDGSRSSSPKVQGLSVRDRNSPTSKLLASCRSSSPKVSLCNGSLCSSPRLIKPLENGGSRSSSPRLTKETNGSRSCSPRLGKETRSASPRLAKVSETNGSRSSSPRLAKVVETNGIRSDSPGLACATGRGSRSNSPKVLNGTNDSVKCNTATSGCGGTRNNTLRQSGPQGLNSSALLASLPVEEKISVDVTMSSEASSDVTSPGAEDRANSTALEEAGDFDSGGHVCYVSDFAPHTLPSLVHIPPNGLRPNGGRSDKPVKDGAKTLSKNSHVGSDSKVLNNRKR